VREDWEEHLPRKPSSCTPFLKDNLAGDDDEPSICRRCQPNSLAILNDGKELFPVSNCLRRTGLLIKRTGAEAHRESEPTRGLGSSCGYAPQ
jgi:hypothetical protein